MRTDAVCLANVRQTPVLAAAIIFSLSAGIATVTIVFSLASGLFAVLSHAVAHRTREFGIRMALGAERSDVLRLILRQGMTTALAGTCIGIAAALSLARIASAVLNGVDGVDLRAVAAASVMLLLVALVACIVPALRATRVDPITALE